MSLAFGLSRVFLLQKSFGLLDTRLQAVSRPPGDHTRTSRCPQALGLNSTECARQGARVEVRELAEGYRIGRSLDRKVISDGSDRAVENKITPRLFLAPLFDLLNTTRTFQPLRLSRHPNSWTSYLQLAR